MSGLALPWLALIFAGAAAAIWLAGIQLSNQTDVLSTRLHLGSALGGLILLAVATNLPEIAIVASAALADNIGVAVGNILGGIAIQTVVLVVLDAFGVRGGKSLTYRAASLVLVLEAGLVVAVLSVVVAGSQLPDNLIVLRLTPAPVLILILWVVGLLLLRRAGRSLPWHESGEAPDNQEPARGHSRHKREQQATKRGISTGRSAAIFGAAALVTLVAGVFLERSGDAIAGHIGLSGVLFGATVLAAATSLPEVSTGLTSVRNGDYQLAMSDIFGGNAFLPVLFVVATLLSGKAVLPQAQSTDIYLTAVAILLTMVYAAGLLFRPQRRIARMGLDSLTVLILYVVAVAGLFAVAGAG
ncbi:cation:H+ antiporter [Actinopolymorpha cephalotaxi]|uniref:Cation:H+ antiporter n=1 Tax=Actinopolymorpha cephalotaxi TaxID=504797 RepID=A0A1I3A9Y5_9ACTN|nr:sodium:proton exchanger [Actinopolymorpha cephalotaxi]NYH85256.1 cation:H+ antiporter [Actinopolymorpha cephalotaxi]SFH46894.1 cation:H+ antiporter [Actinopolymorpha cephalotaxi]